MKTKILSLTISILLTTVGFSQISINLSGTNTSVSGTIQPYELTETVTAHSMHNFDVINSSGGDLDLIVTRKIVSETNGWSNFLCFGPSPFGTCYPANSDQTWSTNPETIVDTAVISTYVTAPSSGSAQYRYYVSEDGSNFLDSVDILVSSTANINSPDFVEFATYPNPASDVLVLKNGVPFNYALISASGSIIFKSENESTFKQLDISSLPSGFYLLEVRSNNAQIVKKVQVQ